MSATVVPTATLANVLRIFAWILGVFVLIEVGIAALLLHNAWEKRDTWSRAAATVTALEKVESTDTAGHTWRPIFSLPVGEQVYTIRSSSSSNPPAYDVGEKVEMLYPADKPEDAVPNTFWGLYIWPLVLFGLAAMEGLVILVLMLLGWYFRRREAVGEIIQ